MEGLKKGDRISNLVVDHPLISEEFTQTWTVYDGNLDSDKMLVYYKNFSDLNKAKRIAAILEQLHHPNILRFYTGNFEEPIGLVMEFHPEAKDLDNFAFSASLSEKKKLFSKIAAAISYMHAKNICHGNIAPNCVWVMPDGEPKLRNIGGELDSEKLFPYISPYHLKNETVENEKFHADWYAFASLMMVIFGDQDRISKKWAYLNFIAKNPDDFHIAITNCGAPKEIKRIRDLLIDKDHYHEGVKKVLTWGEDISWYQKLSNKIILGICLVVMGLHSHLIFDAQSPAQTKVESTISLLTVAEEVDMDLEDEAFSFLQTQGLEQEDYDKLINALCVYKMNTKNFSLMEFSPSLPKMIIRDRHTTVYYDGLSIALGDMTTRGVVYKINSNNIVFRQGQEFETYFFKDGLTDQFPYYDRYPCFVLAKNVDLHTLFVALNSYELTKKSLSNYQDKYFSGVLVGKSSMDLVEDFFMALDPYYYYDNLFVVVSAENHIKSWHFFPEELPKNLEEMIYVIENENDIKINIEKQFWRERLFHINTPVQWKKALSHNVFGTLVSASGGDISTRRGEAP